MNKNDDSYLLFGCHKCKMYIMKIVVGVFHIRSRFLSTFITKINVKYSEQQNTQSIFCSNEFLMNPNLDYNQQ